MRSLVLLVLLLPGAAAGVAFETDVEDAAGDVVTMDGAVVAVPSADILRIRSEILQNGTRVRQSVEMGARPIAPDDSILLRSWFHDSVNGSFHTIDMEVRGSEPDVEKRFKPIMRRGDFYNTTFLNATYGLSGSTWIFEFPADLVEDATCFDAGAFSEHSPAIRTRRPQGFDSAYLPTRACVTAEEPGDDFIPPPIRIGVPERAPEPPGSVTPTPLGGWVALVAVGGVAWALRRRG